MEVEQMTIFDYVEKPFKITKPIRLIELFAGIGSQAMALKSIGADFTSWKVVEIDKFAIASYNAIHGTKYKTLDITQIKGEDLEIVDVNRFTYLLTYSFPCVDLSLAGTMSGMEEGSGTRSSLLWEVKRLLEESPKLPQVLLMENVTQVHNENNREHFQEWIKYLESKGYKNFWQDMNSKNYGVAQSRRRTIMVSFLGEGWFKFPKPYKLKRKMADYLEENVDEKYFLTEYTQKLLIDNLLPNVKVDKGSDLVIDKVLVKQSGGKILTPCKIRGVADLNFPKSETRRGRVIKGGDISPTLTTHNLLNVLESGTWEDEKNKYLIKIRFLTSREYWRLMGFSDEDYEKAQKINSDRQLYRQAGNSIVKNVLCEVFRQMIEQKGEL